MIVFLNLKKSKPKQESWRFVISYYHDDEKEYIEKIKGVEKLKYGKYAFTASYIDWYNLAKDWINKTGLPIALHAEDFYDIYYVVPVKVKQEQREHDLKKLLALDNGE